MFSRKGMVKNNKIILVLFWKLRKLKKIVPKMYHIIIWILVTENYEELNNILYRISF